MPTGKGIVQSLNRPSTRYVAREQRYSRPKYQLLIILVVFKQANNTLVWSETVRIVNEWISYLESEQPDVKNSTITIDVLPALTQVQPSTSRISAAINLIIHLPGNPPNYILSWLRPLGVLGLRHILPSTHRTCPHLPRFSNLHVGQHLHKDSYTNLAHLPFICPSRTIYFSQAQRDGNSFCRIEEPYRRAC